MSLGSDSGLPGAVADLAATRQRVLAEAARFRARLPALMSEYAEQWVVFRDDVVVSAHATEEEAYVAGLDRFGPDGGHVVAMVRQPEPAILSAVIAFGL